MSFWCVLAQVLRESVAIAIMIAEIIAAAGMVISPIFEISVEKVGKTVLFFWLVMLFFFRIL